MAGVRSKPTNGGLYQAWFRDYTGKKRYFTLPSKKKAREQAHSLEKQHREIRDGYRPLPNSAQASRKCLYEELLKNIWLGANHKAVTRVNLGAKGMQSVAERNSVGGRNNWDSLRWQTWTEFSHAQSRRYVASRNKGGREKPLPITQKDSVPSVIGVSSGDF